MGNSGLACIMEVVRLPFVYLCHLPVVRYPTANQSDYCSFYIHACCLKWILPVDLFTWCVIPLIAGECILLSHLIGLEVAIVVAWRCGGKIDPDELHFNTFFNILPTYNEITLEVRGKLKKDIEQGDKIISQNEKINNSGFCLWDENDNNKISNDKSNNNNINNNNTVEQAKFASAIISRIRELALPSRSYRTRSIVCLVTIFTTGGDGTSIGEFMP